MITLYNTSRVKIEPTFKYLPQDKLAKFTAYRKAVSLPIPELVKRVYLLDDMVNRPTPYAYDELRLEIEESTDFDAVTKAMLMRGLHRRGHPELQVNFKGLNKYLSEEDKALMFMVDYGEYNEERFDAVEANYNLFVKLLKLFPTDGRVYYVSEQPPSPEVQDLLVEYTPTVLTEEETTLFLDIVNTITFEDVAYTIAIRKGLPVIRETGGSIKTEFCRLTKLPKPTVHIIPNRISDNLVDVVYECEGEQHRIALHLK